MIFVVTQPLGSGGRWCLSLAKTRSIRFKSDEYFGRKKSLAPTERMNWRTALLLWLPRLSRTTMSPGRRTGRRTFCIDPVTGHGCEEGHGFPAAVGDLGVNPAPAGAHPQGCHIGPGPGLVDEDEPLSFDAILIFVHGARRRASSGRSRSPAATLFLADFSACTKSQAEW